jgi:hypothetical protein
MNGRSAVHTFLRTHRGEPGPRERAEGATFPGADQAGIGIVTVRQLEAGVNVPRRATLEVVRRAFETFGVEFIDEDGGGPGVRLRKASKQKSRK